MAVDANGVQKIYPTRAGGAEFISNANLASNNQFVIDGNMVSDGGGVFHMTDYSQCRNTANPKTNYRQESAGGNQGDFLRRGYESTPDDWLNFEMTEYIQVSSWSPTDSEIILKGPTGTHHGGGTDCGHPDDVSGASYGCRTGMENPTNTEFFKEQHHVCYESDNFVDLPSMGNFKDGNWHGIKFINYEVMVGNKKCRKLEHWLDEDGDGIGFVKVNEMIDQGGWGNSAKAAGAPNADQIITWAAGRAMWRYDATSTNLKFKWLACREIDVNGNPDQGGGGTGGGGGQGTAIQQDGVRAIYPNNPTGFMWFMDASQPFDGHLEKGGGSDYSKLTKNGDGSWKPNVDGTTKFNILVTPGEKDAIGGCNMDFHASIVRGYTHKANDVGKPGFEMTAFYKMSSAIGNEGIFMRGPFNHHPSGSGLCCQQSEYDIEVKPDGSFKFTKELNGNVTHPQGVQNITPSFSMVGAGWFGLKFVFIVVSDDPDDPKVRLEGYLNRTGDKITWEKIGTADDFNGKLWGLRDAVCNGDPYQVYAWSSAGLVIKWYDGHVDFKDWSVRTIDPTGTFEDPTPTPDPCPTGQHRDNSGNCVPDSSGGGTGGGNQGGGEPHKITGTFTLLRDINISRTSACSGSTGGGGGGGAAGTPFYSIIPDGSGSNSLDNVRKGIYEFAANSLSMIIGKLPVGIDLYLTKVGSPTGTATAVHRSAVATAGGTDDHIKQTFGTIDVSTIATTETLYTFGPITNTTNKILFRNKIGLEYSGGDADNYILVSRNKPGTYDAQNTYKLTKESGVYVQARDYDLCGIFYEL